MATKRHSQVDLRHAINILALNSSTGWNESVSRRNVKNVKKNVKKEKKYNSGKYPCVNTKRVLYKD